MEKSFITVYIHDYYIFFTISDNHIDMEKDKKVRSMKDIKNLFRKIHNDIACLKQAIDKLNNANKNK